MTRENIRKLKLYLNGDIIGFDEAFFTTTSRCVLPVTVVDGLQIGNGKPGLLTKRLLKAWGVSILCSRQ